MARRTVTLALAASLALASVGCTQIGSAVKGFESGPGGWQRAQARADMSSDVQYLGASADGAIIVRMPDGSVEMWRR